MSRYVYKPEALDEIRPLSDLPNFLNEDSFCTRIVFDPEEDDCFKGCPPFVVINTPQSVSDDQIYFFEIPEIIAYYAKTHAGYTWKGRKNSEEQGKRELRNKLKSLLEL